MTAFDVDDPAATDQVRELLPWFAAGTLAPHQRQFVDAWLARHGAQHPALVAELSWLRRSAAQARELAQAQAPAPEAGLAELMARIGAERGRAAPAAPGAQHFGRRFSHWLAELLAPRPALAFGLVAVMLLQGAVIGSLLTREPAAIVPLGGSRAPLGSAAADAVVLSVVFSASAREAEVRAVLAAAGAQIVGGPSALGLYLVAVPQARAEAAVATLQASRPTVESVQREP